MMKKGSLLVLILALCVSCAYCDDCDFNIASTSDLDGVIANQNWVSTPKILCFAAGNYSYVDGPAYAITAPQVWRGARVKEDPTCKQRVNPPCSRLQSAKSFDGTVESVFVVSNAVSNPLFTMSSGTFNFSGFSVNFQTSNTNFASADTLFMYNNYIMTQGSISVNEIDAYSNYFESAFSTNPTISTSSSSGTVQYNYFTKCSTALSGSVNDIQHNSFINNIVAINNPSFPTLSSNLFVFNPTAFSSTNGPSSIINNNSFILGGGSISVTADEYNIEVTNNCFLDDNNIFQIIGFLNATSGSGNYYGPNLLLSGGWIGSSTHFGPPSIHPPSLTSPLICPNNLLSVSVANPNSLSVGDSIKISWTFRTGNLIRSGVDFSSLNQATVHFYFFKSNSALDTHTTLSVTDTIVFNSFGVANNTFSYTPSLSNFPKPPVHGPPNKYYLVAKVFASFDVGGTSYSHTFNATIPTTFWYSIPIECRNRDSTLIINKIQRFNGPVNLNLTDIFCHTNSWNITAINRQPLASPALSVNSDLKSVSFTIDPTQSGEFNFVVDIRSVSTPTIVHGIITHVNLTNHNPIVTPYRQFNFTQWSDVENVNLLANSSDPDLDNITVTYISARGGKSASNIDDLSVYFHFANASFVVVADASGNLSIHSVDLTNPSIPEVGGVITDLSKFKSSFGLNFVVDDGDRVNHLADGGVVFNHIHSSS